MIKHPTFGFKIAFEIMNKGQWFIKNYFICKINGNFRNIHCNIKVKLIEKESIFSIDYMDQATSAHWYQHQKTKVHLVISIQNIETSQFTVNLCDKILKKLIYLAPHVIKREDIPCFMPDNRPRKRMQIRGMSILFKIR